MVVFNRNSVLGVWGTDRYPCGHKNWDLSVFSACRALECGNGFHNSGVERVWDQAITLKKGVRV